ncbi:MAG TPA: hypothetical protein DCP92_22610 [Nitrospiraceae bacterium]|jgi:hypothetical protein|nr:hypothetical protein [Nitrospiraceae bacterium]
MSAPIPEKDWKYLKNIRVGLLSSLCERINNNAMEILQSVELSSCEKYRALFQHIEDSNKIVAQCFDDWRRSNIWLKVAELNRNNVLTEEHVRHLSEETRQRIKRMNQLNEEGF